jgi:hypothetical protein
VRDGFCTMALSSGSKKCRCGMWSRH